MEDCIDFFYLWIKVGLNFAWTGFSFIGPIGFQTVYGNGPYIIN